MSVEAPAATAAPTTPAIASDAQPTNKIWLHRFLETWIEKGLRALFWWETDDKKLGGLIRFLHHSMVYFGAIWYILIHTIIPNYFLFVCFYGLVLAVWLQHVITGGCLFTKIEQKLIGDKKSFVDPLMEAFHLPVNSESTVGFVVLGSTVVTFMLTFELLSRTIVNIRSWFS